MNKVVVTGFAHEIKKDSDEHGTFTTFLLKTKKKVGGAKGYDYIPCDIRGRTATRFYDNAHERERVNIVGKFNLEQDENNGRTYVKSLAVEEFELVRLEDL